MRLFQRSALAIAPAVALALTLAACGASSTAITRTVTVTQPTTTSDTPATTADDAASRPSAVGVARRTRALAGFTRCDTNITAKKHTTTCAFAQNVFYAYWQDGGTPSIRAYSPATDVTYRLRCEETTGQVVCSAGDGAVVKFSIDAVDRYTSAQARAYASSRDLGPTATPTTRVPETAVPDPAPAVAPPPPPVATGTGDFCSTHDCIPNYDNGNGTTVQCSDGTFSHSGGIQGACSHHGGVG